MPHREAFGDSPRYVRVDVRAEVALLSLENAGETEAAVARALARFLHPLTGGADSQGWAFGRKPKKSDLYSVIQAVDGVDHVRTVRIDEHAELGAGTNTDHDLVYSGQHTIRSVLSEP